MSRRSAPAKKECTVMDNEEYIRVGTCYLKLCRVPTATGEFREKYLPWNIETIRQDHSKDFVANIKKYDGYWKSHATLTLLAKRVKVAWLFQPQLIRGKVAAAHPARPNCAERFRKVRRPIVRSECCSSRRTDRSFFFILIR